MESPPRIGYGGNGADGNGHHETIGIGPTVELQPGIDRHANGNGHHDEAPEPPAWPADRQQSLFSWAEFMADEPVKPRGRGRKPQPASLSMFEWAMTLEQQREGEPVGAGRQTARQRGGRRSCMPLFLQLRPVPLPWPGHMCLLFPLPSTGYGPLTVNTNSLDSIRPSSVQIAPCSSQSSVTGRMIVAAPSVLGLTVIR